MASGGETQHSMRYCWREEEEGDKIKRHWRVRGTPRTRRVVQTEPAMTVTATLRLWQHC